MSYLHDINTLCQNEDAIATTSDIDMPSIADYEIPSQQTQNPLSLFHSFQSEFISKEQLESLAPFQNMFNQSSECKAEHNPAVFKPRSPWEDESYHLDNFIPFLTKPKKLKLSDISDQNLPTNSNSTDPHTAQSNSSQELRECDLLDRVTSDIINLEDDLISNSHQTVAEEYEGLSLLERARKFLDKKDSVNLIQNEIPVRDEERMDEGEEEVRSKKQRPRLYPGYKPGKSFVDELCCREGTPNSYPESDLASPESYSLQHVHLLIQQIYNLIDGEADNIKRIQSIKESYNDANSDLYSLHRNLDSTLDHSLNVLMECQNACQRVSKLEEHASILAHILVNRGIVKGEDTDSD